MWVRGWWLHPGPSRPTHLWSRSPLDPVPPSGGCSRAKDRAPAGPGLLRAGMLGPHRWDAEVCRLLTGPGSEAMPSIGLSPGRSGQSGPPGCPLFPGPGCCGPIPAVRHQLGDPGRALHLAVGDLQLRRAGQRCLAVSSPLILALCCHTSVAQSRVPCRLQRPGPRPPVCSGAVRPPLRGTREAFPGS